MKRLALFMVFNLGLNGILLGASSVTSSPNSPVPTKSLVSPVLSPGPVVNQAVPAATPAPAAAAASVQPIPDQMSALQATTINEMSNLAADGVKALTQHAQTTTDGMNIVQKQALASPKIGSLPNLQTYLDQLTNFANTGQKSLSNLALEIKNNINKKLNDGSAKIQALAGTDSTNLIIASTDINSLNTQAAYYNGQIDHASSQDMDEINNLLTTAEATINDAYNAAKNSSGSSGEIKDILAGILSSLGSSATVVALYYAKQIGCKFGFGICPPVDAETEAIIKRFKLPGNIDALLEKVGCKNVSELLNRSAKSLDAVKQNIAENLGVAQDKINDLVGKAGKSLGASDEAVTNLLQKLGDIQEAVQKAIPSANVEDIMKTIGSKLNQVTGQDFNVTEIANQVKTALNASSGSSAEGPVAEPVESGPAAPASNGGAAAKGSSAPQGTYEKLQASSMSARDQFLEEIKTGGLTLDDFNSRIEQLQAQMQAATSAQEKANLQEQIDAASDILTDAEKAPGTDLDPFTIEL